MTRPPTETLRRLCLVAAVAAALVLAGIYGLRRWRAYQARRGAPAPVAEDVQQQAEKFTFSRSAEGRTLFTVEASRTIERTGKTTILEEVVAVIHGTKGDRADEIRTGRCEYDVEGSGEIFCGGEVTVKLRGTGTAASPEPSRSMLVSTSGVRFNTAQGSAVTDQPVHFTFPQGTGEGVGLRYQSQEPAVVLESRVKLHIARPGAAPLEVEGAQLHYYSRTQELELLPPLRMQAEDRSLVADRVRMKMDENYTTQQLEATGRVRIQARQNGRDVRLEAPRAVAFYAPDGNLERLRASGGAVFTRQGPDGDDTLTCREAVFTFDPSHRWVEHLVATGAAEVVMHAAKETRTLRAPRLEFLPGGPGETQQVLTATERGTLLLTGNSGEQRTLTADRIEMRFRDNRRLEALAASGSVETESLRSGGTTQATRSDELRSRFDEQGNVAEAEQWGGFRYESSDSRAEAGRALYNAATESYLLREKPAVWNATMRTTARVIELSDKTGSVRAEGDVLTTQRAAEKGDAPATGFGGREPVHFSSDRLHAEREKNWARYEGRARMWQGENRLAADSIELFQSPDKLVADGNVSGLFFEAATKSENTPAETPPPERNIETKPAAAPAQPRQAVTITSDHFTYVEEEHRGVFQDNVKAHNGFGRLTAPRLEVFLQTGGGQDSQSLERAHARGGVFIERPDGQATGEEAEYRADAQTVVLWGGSPRIVDNRNGTVTGPELTLFLADGRILVNSGEGERTISRRPWTR